MTEFAAIMALGLAIDAIVGWPERLFRRIGHPVVWLGSLISTIERGLNTGPPMVRRWKGVACVLATTLAAAVPALVIQLVLPDGILGVVLGALLAWPWIAARSLYDHVEAVRVPLSGSNIDGARSAVSMIVGRDPSKLDEPAVARAAVESLAENASDGVVAPLFWGAVAGLPGLVAYKAVNTMDSMIGHRSERYEDFGKAAALLDDGLNILPARITGFLIALVSSRPSQAIRTMLRDAPQHRSPNAGWPEGAMAGALGVRLSGPRAYDGHTATEAWVNERAPDPDAGAMSRALATYVRAVVLFGAGLLALALI